MPAGGEAAARRFYSQVLGLTELPKPPVLAARGGAWFASGPVQIHLGVEEDFRPARKAHPAIRVDDLDDLTAQITAAGYEVRFDDDLPGYRRFYVADPFGNRLDGAGEQDSAIRDAGSTPADGAGAANAIEACPSSATLVASNTPSTLRSTAGSAIATAGPCGRAGRARPSSTNPSTITGRIARCLSPCSADVLADGVTFRRLPRAGSAACGWMTVRAMAMGAPRRRARSTA